MNDHMTYTEEELLPLSGLQHLAFCARQCALMHVENTWEDNHLTVLGSLLHERTHTADVEHRDGMIIRRSLPLRSLRLGLVGKADVVEFRSTPDQGATLPSEPGQWMPSPVEYKRGSPKLSRCDEVQLCAQAMCLEEMLNMTVAEGSLYYGEPRRRYPVNLGRELREETQRLALELHALVDSGLTPPGMYKPKCRSCSLFDRCLPQNTKRPRSARRFVASMIKEALATGPGDAP